MLLGLLVGVDLRRRRHRRASTPAPAPSRVAELLAVVDDEVAKLVASGVTESELDVAKGYIEGSMVLGLEDSGSRMARLGRSLMARDEIVPLDEQLARIRAVTADDVAAVAARVFGSARSLAVVGHVDPSPAALSVPADPRQRALGSPSPSTTSTTRSMPTASSSGGRG